MAIFTGSELKARPSLGSEMDHATDASAAFARVEPLLLPSQLVNRQLAGIPLYSALPDPVTKQRFNFGNDEYLKDRIEAAVAQFELDSGVRVTPMQVTRRMPFDMKEYQSLGFMRLPDAPITEIIRLWVADSTLNAIFEIPPVWVEAGHLQKGQLGIVPLQPAWVGGGIVSTADSAGGAAFIALLGSKPWVPAWWVVEYRMGFPESRVPRIVNEAIGCAAGIDILSRVQATNKVASYGINLDGAGQNISTAGVQVYAEAIKGLQDQYKGILGKLKAKFNKKFYCDNV